VEPTGSTTSPHVTLQFATRLDALGDHRGTAGGGARPRPTCARSWAETPYGTPKNSPRCDGTGRGDPSTPR
jgi:hypothetical protein